MPRIVLKTEIDAPIEVCFDLSRSIDLHQISTAHTNQQAIDGVTSGLINLHESVTWRARHFGFNQKLTSKIVKFERPYLFVDQQTKGIFKSMIHEHRFENADSGVLMTDIFDFEAPFGLLGIIFSKFVLTVYLKKLLLRRNMIIKEYAESEKWKMVLLLE